MENLESKLLHLKAVLYAILAFLLCVVLLVGFGNTEPDKGCGVKSEQAFCGTNSSNSSNPQFQKGKALFLMNCASCHNKNMQDDLTGPALGDVEERWSSYPRKDLYQWIRRSQAMIKSGHPLATELWAKWEPTIMNDFPGLKDEDIEAILAYVREQSGPLYLKAEVVK